jgi:hypothetical protein
MRLALGQRFRLFVINLTLDLHEEKSTLIMQLFVAE